MPRVADALRASFLAEIRDREGNQPPDDAIGLRLLDPTEKNALRLPFFNAAFPDAIFIYIHREPRETLTEIVAAWESISLKSGAGPRPDQSQSKATSA